MDEKTEVSETVFRSAFDSSDDIVIICNKTWEPVWLNERARTTTEDICDRLRSNLPDEFGHAAQESVHEWLETVESRERVRTEFELEIEPGKTVPYEFHTRPFTNGSGDLLGTVTTGREISTRKEREDTLTALHAAARKIGRADDSQTVYETLVAAGERILKFDLVVVDVERNGYLVQEAWKLGSDDSEYYERTSLEEDDTFAIRAYNRQETIVVDDLRKSEITPADPTYRSALTVPIGEFGTFQAATSEVDAFDDRDREFAEILVGHAEVKLTQLQDKQALREQTTELEERNEQLDEFMRVISHDLRNQLHKLDMSFELVESDTSGEHIERCSRILNRTDQLLDELLTLAREGEEIREVEPVDLSAVVEEVWATIDAESATHVVETDRILQADRGRLKQLFENLLHNAVDHGAPAADEDRTQVTVTVGELPDGFYVADDGPGIPPEDRDRVFDTQYSTAEEGTGIGLSIVKQIVDAHDWDVRITESSEGGARFEITGVSTATGTDAADER